MPQRHTKFWLANPVGDNETDQHDPGAQIINTLKIPGLVSL